MRNLHLGALACIVATFGAASVAACGSGSVEQRQQTGTAKLSLTGVSASGTTYRLRNAVFTVSGPTNTQASTETDPSQTSIVLDLRAGDYSINLESGWSLEKQTATGFVPVDAALSSTNPRTFSVVEQANTGIVYEFAAGDEIVELGDGTAEISISVDDVNCAVGLVQCGTTCVDVASDPTNCGACGNVCEIVNGSSACVDGVCQVQTCSSGTQDCDNDASTGCETDVTGDVNNCGACGMTCPAVGGNPMCQAGACGIQCFPGRANCDANSSNGCETDIFANLNNCGGCGMVCNAPNAIPICNAGVCSINQCLNGMANCDGSIGNGCETPLDLNPVCGAAQPGGTISGDASSSTLSFSGLGEKRFSFHVSEDDNGPTQNDLSVRFVLNTPPGVVYRLEAGCDGCTTAQSATGPSAAVTLRWNEDTGPLGIPASDSSREVFVNIVYVSGSSCASWSLQAQGNVPGGPVTCSER